MTNVATMYYPAPDEAAVLVNHRIATHHEDMHAMGVRVGVLFARNDTGPAVKLHGNACHATIRVVSHKDRVTKGYDAEMVIDARSWEEFEGRRRLALVAHELKHLVLVKKVDPDTKQAAVQFDDGGRPKLKTRPGDWTAGDGFAEIVAEFQDDAIEFFNIRTAWKLAESAKLNGPAEPEPSLLDVARDVAREHFGDGVTVSMAERFKEAGNGVATVAGTRSGVDAAADGGRVEDDANAGPGDDFGFGPSNSRFDRRTEGASYDERTNGI